VNANLGRGAGGKCTPEIEHGDLMADVEDQVGMVLDQQHTGAAGADRLDQPGQPLDLVIGKAGGGLIQQQEIRIEHQRAGDLDEAQFAVLQPVRSHLRQRFQPDDAKQGARLGRQHPLILCVARQRQHRLDKTRFALDRAADHDVLQH